MREEAGGIGACGGRTRRYTMGKWGIKSLKTKVEWECSISRAGARLNNEGIQVGGVREESHSVTSRGAAGVRAAKSYKFGERE